MFDIATQVSKGRFLKVERLEALAEAIMTAGEMLKDLSSIRDDDKLDKK